MSEGPYGQLREQALMLERKYRDFTPENNHDDGLYHEIRELITDCERSRHPRDIENRIKSIQNMLKSAERIATSGVNYSEYDFLHDHYEQLKMAIRRFPNY